MRPRFSLRLFLIAFTLIAILFGAVAHWFYGIKQQVRRMGLGIAKVQELGGAFARRVAEPEQTPYEEFVQRWVDRDAYRPATAFEMGSPYLLRLPADRIEEALTALQDVYGVPCIAISIDRLTVKAMRLLAAHPRLVKLDIDCDEIEPGAEAQLEKIQSLVALRIDCKVSDEVIAAAAQLPMLTRLSINPDNLTATGANHLATIQKLESLELMRSNNPAPTLEALASHPSLVYLEFWTCTLDDEAVAAISKMRCIKHFRWIGSGEIPAELLPAIASSRQLETLELHDLDVAVRPAANHGLSELARCPRLEYIEAQCIQVSSQDLLAFKGHPELRGLTFSGIIASEHMDRFSGKLQHAR